MPAIPAELYRFPDRGGGIFYGCIYRSVVQTDSTVVSKTSDFGSYPDRPAIASWCNGNTSGSEPEVAGSNPAEAALGH